MAGTGPGTGRRWRPIRSRTLRAAGGARSRGGVRRTVAYVLPALLLAGAVSWVLLGTSLVSVRRIEVTGSTMASADQVRAAAGVTLGTPLARVDTSAVAGRVERLPPVAQADVSRAWPSTLVIRVRERQAVAVVAQGHRFLVLDGSGVVFTTAASRPGGAVVLVVPAPGPADPATRAGLTVIAALTAELRTALGEVVVDTPTDIHLDLADGRLIIWGDADQSAKKARVATLLLGRASKRIDVSAPDVVAVS